MGDRWTDRLSEHADGELAGEESLALESHLATCAECRRTLDELRAVKLRAGALVDPPAPDDLWAGIASRIGPAGSSSAGGRVHGARLFGLPGRRPASLTWFVPRLAAAGFALLLLSASALWWAARGPGRAAAPRVATTASPDADASFATFDADRVDGEIAQLRHALEAGRGRLTPQTIAVLEKNLKVIEQATADARAALARDPANRELLDYFTGTVQRKLDLMKRAAALAGV